MRQIILDGDALGGALGGWLVVLDGESEGEADGEVVGFSVGWAIGGSLGMPDGESMGYSLGRLDGKSEGDVLGSVVGEMVGSSVGESVGELEGLCCSHTHGHCAVHPGPSPTLCLSFQKTLLACRGVFISTMHPPGLLLPLLLTPAHTIPISEAVSSHSSRSSTGSVHLLEPLVK